MTKEELEKEAGEYAKPFHNMTRYDYVEERTHVKEAYLAGAEPREKRIEELEDTIANLKEQVQSQVEATIELDKENADLRDNYDQFKAVAVPEIERLQKENAELKEQNSHLYNYLTMTEAENAGRKDQLTKAKEIINNLMLEVKGYEEVNGFDTCEPVQKAEQFLKEIEK